MVFRVPRYQRVAGTALILMGVIVLYYQAAKGEGIDALGSVLGLIYLLLMFAFTFSLGCGLPLKRVLSGEHIGPSGRVVPIEGTVR